MKISVAQTRPVKGDIQQNIDKHKKLLAVAVSNNAAMIIFPELSITGYEPELAKDLVTDKDDRRFDDFQKISNTENIIIGIGAPLKSETGITISMIIFQPRMPRQTYAKQYLHADEYLYFVSGQEQLILRRDNHTIAPAICYELSVPEHSSNAFKLGAAIYIATVAKTAAGVDKAHKDLAGIARNYSMTVLLSNCVGTCDGVECGGRTSAWNNKGILLGELGSTAEGILILDTDTNQLINQTI